MHIFSAHLPHTPLLIPTIGKEQQSQLKETITAIKQLVHDATFAQPEVLVILGSHGRMHVDAFSANIAQRFMLDFSEFGDHTPSPTFLPALPLADLLQRRVRQAQLGFTLESEPRLDHGTAVALSYLASAFPNIPVLPLMYSGQSAKEHVQFGRVLREVFEEYPKRIAFFSTGDLSHCLTEKAPAGYRPQGKQYDETLLHALQTSSLSSLLQLDSELVKQAQECAYLPLLTHLGLLEGLQITPEQLSYEAPFGVGYLTMRFHLP